MKHTTSQLTAQEKEIERALKQDEYETVADLSREKERFTAAAHNTNAKNKTITLRISERSLMRLKAVAAREGVSYQSYVTSLIHKHT